MSGHQENVNIPVSKSLVKGPGKEQRTACNKNIKNIRVSMETITSFILIYFTYIYLCRRLCLVFKINQSIHSKYGKNKRDFIPGKPVF